MSEPDDDPRSVDDLFSAALADPDEDRVWDAIGPLQRRGTREVLERAVGLCASACPIERRIGANVLAQLGTRGETFPEECGRILLGMLDGESVPDVLHAVLLGLHHRKVAEAIEPALRLARHDDLDVRVGVVFVLMSHEDSRAIAGLIAASADADSLVRDWATFGLSMMKTDSTEIRETLLARLADEDAGVREEALRGLARRGDRRAYPPLRERLAADDVNVAAVEAAEAFADPDLRPLLVELRSRWTHEAEFLEDAIAACSARA